MRDTLERAESRIDTEKLRKRNPSLLRRLEEKGITGLSPADILELHELGLVSLPQDVIKEVARVEAF